jgi:hypothetical protein
MKRTALIFPVLVLLILSFGAGAALGAVQQGLLVDKNGDPVEGFSHVWIIDGVAQPIYNPTTHLWYPVFILGSSENGVVLCAVGAPLGTLGDYHAQDRHEVEEHIKPR